MTAVIFAGNVTVLLAVLACKFKRRHSRMEPGEWIAIVGALLSLAALLQAWHALYGYTSVKRSECDPLSWSYWPSIFVTLLTATWAAIFLYLAARSSNPRRWRAVFALIAVRLGFGTAILAVVFVSGSWLKADLLEILAVDGWMEIIFAGVGLPAIGTNAFLDYRQSIAHRWMHWLGILLYAASSGLILSELPFLL
jgi:hypothetical protein